MKLLAIDPANKESAFVLMEDYKPLEFDKRNNEDVLGVVKAVLSVHPDCHVAIEMVASYGLPVGKDVFETCVYIGRLIEHCNSIEECQEKVREYINKYELGSGQWDGGKVFDEKDEYLGYISYNSRFWKKEN